MHPNPTDPESSTYKTSWNPFTTFHGTRGRSAPHVPITDGPRAATRPVCDWQGLAGFCASPDLGKPEDGRRSLAESSFALEGFDPLGPGKNAPISAQLRT